MLRCNLQREVNLLGNVEIHIEQDPETIIFKLVISVGESERSKGQNPSLDTSIWTRGEKLWLTLASKEVEIDGGKKTMVADLRVQRSEFQVRIKKKKGETGMFNKMATLSTTKAANEKKDIDFYLIANQSSTCPIDMTTVNVSAAEIKDLTIGDA